MAVVTSRPHPGRSSGPHTGPGRATAPGPRASDESGAREGFRPDLEGLRAVAVGLVLLFHAGVPFVGGGYVGVDVFFVLSGFLITGLIVRELEQTGTVSLVAFYARRARRLLPAAAVALLATVIASAIFLPPLRVPDVARDGAAAALYVSNMRFAFQATDYLQAAEAPSPLLHYWSLGVEEQFYLFWPALLLLVARRGRGTLVGRLARVVAVVFVVSLVLSLVLTNIAQPWAFFTLPARAWELALGAALALLAWRGIALPGWSRAPAGILGVASIVVAGVALDTGSGFPGVAALLPTLGAALVIAAGLKASGSGSRSGSGSALRRGASPRSMAAVSGEPIHVRLLSLAPMRWLGRISYSLYLWHWPILVIPAAAGEAALPLRARLLLAGLSIVVAALSQRFVEEPIRRGRFVGFRPRRSLAMAGVLTLVVTSLSMSLTPGGAFGAPYTLAGSGSVDERTIARDLDRALGSPPPGPTPKGSPAASAATPSKAPAVRVPANLTPALGRARDDLPSIYANGCHQSYDAVRPGTCAFGDRGSATTVVLMGDSHAAQWFPALLRAATAHHWRLLSFTKSACAPADIAVWDPTLKRAYTECAAWRSAVLRRIAAERPALVVVSMSRAYTLAIGGKAAPLAKHRAAMRSALARTLTSLARSSREVALIAETPHQRLDPPVCLSAHMMNALACATPLSKAINMRFLDLEAKAAKAADVALVDATAWICPSDPCPVVIGHVLVYRDMHHMTETFNRALAAYLVAALPAVKP